MLHRRLPTTAIALFGLAAVCAVAAAGLIAAYARRLESTRPDLGAPVPVVVAATDLVRGATITEPMLAERDVPRSLVPPGAATQAAAIVGRVLASDVTAGEAITASRLAGSRAGPVAGLVPAGELGVVVASGLPPGAVQPGDTVTLFATFGGRSPHSETVAEGVEVLRILVRPEGVSGVEDAGGDPLVVVVDAVAAQRIAYASAFATISVAVEAPIAVASPSAPVAIASP